MASILDIRKATKFRFSGNPTVEVDVILEDRLAEPRGGSLTRPANTKRLDLRDDDTDLRRQGRFNGG